MMAIHTRITYIQQLSMLSTLQLTLCPNVHFFQIHILFLRLRYNSSFRFILCLYNDSETYSSFFYFFFKILNTLILFYQPF